MGPKKAPVPKTCHTYPTMMKLGSYTLHKEDPKKDMNYVLLTSAFVHQKSSNFAISINTDIGCILVHNFYSSFNFFWIFTDWFNKYRYDFDDVSKNGYSRPS